MAENIVPVRLETKSKGLAERLGHIISSIEGFQIHPPGDAGPFEVLILEMGEDLERDFEMIQSLSNLGTVKEVFLTAPNQDPKVLVRALRAGIREFLRQPVSELEVKQALENFRQRRGAVTKAAKWKRSGKIINVVASKGGVGNTTIAVNLAISLARLHGSHSVVLVDMNLLFGEIPLFLDIKPSFHWGEVMSRHVARLDAMFLMSVLHKHNSGIYVLPSPGELNGSPPLSPHIFEKLLVLMKSLFDYTIIDSGNITDSGALRGLEMSDNILITSTLSVPCLTNLNRLSRILYDLGFTQGEGVRLIINRYMKDASISLRDAEDSVRMKVSWTVPNDFKLTMNAINVGKSLFELNKRSPVSRSILQIATDLSRSAFPEKKKSFLSKIFKRG